MKFALFVSILAFGSWMMVIARTTTGTNQTGMESITHSNVFDFHTISPTVRYLVDFPQSLPPAYSLCECLLVSSLSRVPIKKVIAKEKSTTVACNSHGRSKCHTICTVYAVMNRQYIPKAVCQVLGNGQHLNASVYAQMCYSIKFTGLSIPGEICCSKYNLVRCNK